MNPENEVESYDPNEYVNEEYHSAVDELIDSLPENELIELRAIGLSDEEIASEIFENQRFKYGLLDRR